jgi:hypothetical protein
MDKPNQIAQGSGITTEVWHEADLVYQALLASRSKTTLLQEAQTTPVKEPSRHVILHGDGSS